MMDGWGCTLENIELIKGNFRFEIYGSLILDGDYTKIPIIGKTGSGKSSFLKAIFALEEIEQGSIVWRFPDGKEVRVGSTSILDLDRIRKDYFGFAFQDSTLTEYLSVQENLIYPLLMIGKSRMEAIRTVEEDIAYYLTESESAVEILAQFPHELSGGQRQRISLFQSIIHDPFVVLADEPTGSLDEDTREQIMDILYRWADNPESERLLIWVTHHKSDQETSKAPFVLEVGDGSCAFKEMRSET